MFGEARRASQGALSRSAGLLVTRPSCPPLPTLCERACDPLGALGSLFVNGAPETVLELVERFQANRTSYESGHLRMKVKLLDGARLVCQSWFWCGWPAS